MTELKKILFVDDDLDMLRLARYSLSTLTGVEISYAASGPEALAEAPLFKPDLILLDVLMPEMDGMQTLAALRALPETAQTPVIFLTAKAQEKELASYLALGVVDVIVKPYDALLLGETIQNIWQKKVLPF